VQQALGLRLRLGDTASRGLERSARLRLGLRRAVRGCAHEVAGAGRWARLAGAGLGIVAPCAS
jgi:hypothetical protein